MKEAMITATAAAIIMAVFGSWILILVGSLLLGGFYLTEMLEIAFTFDVMFHLLIANVVGYCAFWFIWSRLFGSLFR